MPATALAAPQKGFLLCGEIYKWVASGGLPDMTKENEAPCLSAVFVDYDNIYLSLKRKDEEAARRFAKEAAGWLREIESGRLLTSTNSAGMTRTRRIVMSRCYGNPVPRRNSRDNSTDMSSFPFVRHHFLRAGFEIIDCPPLTAQLKNSSDIRMVMDMRDYLVHDTRFDEFIILSGDADFTPVLHRLRAHARRTVIYANEHTASPYTAICDAEIREADLMQLLVNGSIDRPASSEVTTRSTAPDDHVAVATAPDETPEPAAAAAAAPSLEQVRAELLDLVISAVQTADQPVPIESLADRAQRTLGADRTAGTRWAGAGTFRAFLASTLPQGFAITQQAPFAVFELSRQKPEAEPEPVRLSSAPATIAAVPQTAPQQTSPAARVEAPPARQGLSQQTTKLQQSITRIHEACQAPPLAPPEYRQLFELLAAEIRDNRFNGDQTVVNVQQRARQLGIEVRRDDARFVLDVVREADPFFEQGVSPGVLAGRFRNFVVARCRGQGLQLSSDEIDLIDAWFGGGLGGSAGRAQERPQTSASQGFQQQQLGPTNGYGEPPAAAARWNGTTGAPAAASAYDPNGPADVFGQEAPAMPRIVRSRARM